MSVVLRKIVEALDTVTAEILSAAKACSRDYLHITFNIAQIRRRNVQGGLKIKFPTSAASKYPDGFDMSLGNFGSPLYGGALTYVTPACACRYSAGTAEFHIAKAPQDLSCIFCAL